jgi:large conductance mechanosensitive channel
MLKEFKEFAMKGNVIDMAVGVIIGGAFGKIVSSLVNDIVMPPIGILVGNVDFSELSIVLSEATAEASAVTLNYGLFINNVVNFLIVAMCIFMMIKAINKLKKPDPVVVSVPTTKDCPYCFSAISLKASKCAFCASSLP